MRSKRELLRRSPTFEHFEAVNVDAIAAHARIRRVVAQEVIIEEGAPADHLYLLVKGAVQLSFQPPADGPSEPASSKPRISIEVVRAPGRLVGWSAMVEPARYRATATAMEPSRLMVLDRDFLEEYCAAHPAFGVAFMRRILSVLGNRLRAARIRLVAARFDEEVLAIQALLDQSAETLPVTSPLHKLPHYLRNRLTVVDAFHVLEVMQDQGEESERAVANLCLEIIVTVRKEMRLYQDLQRVYENVAGAPPSDSPTAVRRRCCVDFANLFSRMDYAIRGEEHLPACPGYIVVMNHLKNHPDNTLPNEFQLTLDTHFVSSMILFRKHGEAPVRVIRKSRPNEFRHQAYYDRLGYLYVFRGHVDTDEGRGDPVEQRKAFLDSGRDLLLSGTTLVICPEGTSIATEDSPTTFRSGAFRLAAYVRPEPLIVPIAVANFDKKITKTRLAAIIFPAFRLSDRIGDPLEDGRLHDFLHSYQEAFRGYVEQAIALARSGHPQ